MAELEQGRSDEDMLRNHAELTRDDLVALREYAKMPVGLRRSCGARAEDAEELDRYLETLRKERRTMQRRPIEPWLPFAGMFETSGSTPPRWDGVLYAEGVEQQSPGSP